MRVPIEVLTEIIEYVDMDDDLDNTLHDTLQLRLVSRKSSMHRGWSLPLTVTGSS